MRIAFLAARPISTMKPTCVRMLLSMPRKTTPVIDAMRLMGTIRITASGSVRLSNWAASTRNTNTTPSANANAAVFPARICWNARSVHSIAETLRQSFGRQLLHEVDRLALRVAGRRRTIEFRRRIEIVARNARRRRDVTARS